METMLDHQTIPITEIPRLIKLHDDANNQVCGFLGECGGGKTTQIKAFINNKENNIGNFLDLNLQTREVFDMQGTLVQTVDEDGNHVTDWAHVEEFKKIVRLAKQGIRSAIFIDEFTNAETVMLGTACRLILDKMAGSLNLVVNGITPLIIVAGNRPQDNTNYNEVPNNFWDRVAVYELKPDSKLSVEYANADGWYYVTTSFLRQFPKAINEGWQPENVKSATGRGWEKVSDLEKVGIPQDLELPILQSIVGKYWATQYQGYRKVIADMIPVEDVIANPTGCPIPDQERPDIMYTMCNMLSYNMNKDNASAIVQYVSRFTDTSWHVLCVSDAIKRDKKLMHNKDVKQFATNNIEVFTDLI